MHVPENLVASQSLALAKQEHERWLADNRDQIGRASDGASVLVLHEDLTVSLPVKTEELTRPAFAAYYLFESAGVTKLVQSLKQCSQPRNMPSIGFTPARVVQRTVDLCLRGLFGQPDIEQPSSKRPKKRIGPSPFAPGHGGNAHGMHDHLVEKQSTAQPQTATRRIHHLNKRTVASPGDDEVGGAVRTAHDGKCGKDCRLVQQDVIERNQDLLRVESELFGNDFDGVDSCPVDIGLKASRRRP